MKTTLISLLAATILGLVYFASGRTFAAADLVAALFALGLTAWTFAQYERAVRPLLIARPIHFPAPRAVRHVATQVGRLAA